MPLHFDNSPTCTSASPYEGPSISNFSTVPIDQLAQCVYEYDASQRIGRVQNFIRDNRHTPASPDLTHRVRTILKDLDSYLSLRGQQKSKDGSCWWSGIHVALGYIPPLLSSAFFLDYWLTPPSAAIHIQSFLASKLAALDPDTMRSLHSHIDQLREVISLCRSYHGFEEDYLDNVQPTWCSLPYHAIRAYRLVEEADTQGVLPRINITLFVEILQSMAPKYRVAGMYAGVGCGR